MEKVFGQISGYSPVRFDRSRTIVSYGMEPVDETHATWYEEYYYKKQVPIPSLDMIKNDIITEINAQITDKIVGGFKWENKPVWYSLENQINFSLSVAPVNLKIGEYEDGSPVYVEFATSEALKAFNDACLAWKNECLEAGRAEKENIDWTPYEELFPQDEPISE